MSLIEQLGGYDAAKKIYDGRPFDLAWSDVGDALLEYRRAHGIFEVGDFVMDISDFPIPHVLKIEVIKENYVTAACPGVDCTLSITEEWPIEFYVRHATDAEIATVRRELEVLHDCDIPPNTIILGGK